MSATGIKVLDTTLPTTHVRLDDVMRDAGEKGTQRQVHLLKWT